ncbi:MAG: MBL fold metallo-hydrolase [Deltaproteobacteria bacterium]|nr:MBL fold metallo-hydrolase [Deltaproteobacteria bacterium]
MALPEEFTRLNPATEHTEKKNAAVLEELPFEDRRSFENAARGFIASISPLTITRPEDGKTTYDQSGLTFLSGEAPPTANPSLWRQAQLNIMHHGLFEVVDGIYQVRSFDIGHMTLVRGKTGWIVIDPLTSAESSRKALDLANEHLGNRPVVAVIYTHSHGDHFLGVTGVIDMEDVEAGKVEVIAPDHFVKEALSENVLVGNVMARRAAYMYGRSLPPSPQGFITCGLGTQLSMGTIGFIAPTDIITKTGETRVIDDVEIVFQMTPDTEAVSEFVFYFPQFRTLCMSEITSHHLHNIYTPRGAQVRDALAWANQINESIDLFGEKLEVLFASHHWPTWGQEAAVGYLKTQRDLYKYIHDQTLRLANHGYTKEEIAEQLKLPDSLAQNFSNRDYYGTVSHNVKAVYVKYLGYFNGNPATLNPLPPVDAARNYIDYMGGAEAIITKARKSFEDGEYRWVAEVMNHVVMADPDNIPARALLADTYEQLGYQAESGPWRNFYLFGAFELRHGVPEEEPRKMRKNIVRGMPLENIFQALAVRLNGPKAAGKRYTFNLSFSDLDKPWIMTVENSVFNAFYNRQDANPTATLSLSSLDFKLMMTGQVTAIDLMSDEKLTLDGDVEKLMEFSELLDKFNQNFPIVTPRNV